MITLYVNELYNRKSWAKIFKTDSSGMYNKSLILSIVVMCCNNYSIQADESSLHSQQGKAKMSESLGHGHRTTFVANVLAYFTLKVR